MNDSGYPLTVASSLPHPPSLRWSLSYGIYDLLGALAAVVALPFLLILALTRYGRGLAERMGWLPAAVRRLRRPIWLHAASVGEVLAAGPLIRALQSQQPDVEILVTTTTVTGRETARARLGVQAVMLLPADVRWIIGRSLRRLQPRCVVIVETELWPAFIRAAARGAVPLVLVSGRISERAARRYTWMAWLARSMLVQMSACAMQTEDDAARIIALGAPAHRVQVLGSLKFARDASPDLPHSAPTATVMALAGDRPLLVAASTQPGEEQLVIEACTPLWAEHPDLLLVIAPRRPERFDEVERLLTGTVCTERRSRVVGTLATDTRVLLLDTIGELLDLLPVARAVFVGGTIAAMGGHNVLEPAIFGKPVAFGPHIENVAGAAQALLRAGAATAVHTAAELRAEWSRLLAQPAVAEAMGTRGRAVIDAHAAVAVKTCDLVRTAMTGSA